MSAEPPPAPPARPGGVRTTRRRGRTSRALETTLATLGPTWTVDPERIAAPGGLEQAFGRSAPLLIDIGIGDGTATIPWAADHPGADVLAVELHRPGIAKLLRAVDAASAANVRIVEGDALVLLDALAPASVAGIRLLFPDPWPKRRHVARRIVDRSFVTRAGDLLVDGGELHLATDWADYAEHMRTMVATDPRFVPVDRGRPSRPVTAYEQRGLDAGRSITDLVYRLVR